MERNIHFISGLHVKGRGFHEFKPSRKGVADITSENSRINAKRVADIYAAFATADSKGAARLVTPDLIIHVPGHSWNAGEYWGIEGLKKFMRNRAMQSRGVLKIEVPVVSVTGDNAFTREIAVLKSPASPERAAALRISNQFRFRNGKLSELWVIPEDLRAYDDFHNSTRPPAQVRSHHQKPSDGRITTSLMNLGSATAPENALLLSEMYLDFWRGDMDAMRHRFSENVEVNITGQSAMSGRYQGWEGYTGFRKKLMAMSGSRYRLDLDALAASEHDLWATEYIRMNRRWDPAVHAIHVVMHFEIDDGLIVCMDDFPVDPYVWEQFYSPPSRGSLAKNLRRRATIDWTI